MATKRKGVNIIMKLIVLKTTMGDEVWVNTIQILWIQKIGNESVKPFSRIFFSKDKVLDIEETPDKIHNKAV